jgi:lipopolysaccharide/colanic/teichoic acid biosynthesis glycosyltransferase
MTRFKHDLILRIIKIMDAVLMTVPFALCWYLYYAKHIASPFYANGDYLVVALFFVLFIIFGRVYDAFLMSMQRISEIVYAQFLAAAVSDFIMYIVIWLLSKHLPNILPGVAALIGQVILAAVWAYNAHHAYFKIFPPQATAVIYDTRQGMEKLIGKYGLDTKYKVVLTATADECIANLAMLDGVSTVFMSGIHSHDRNVILKYCVENNIGTFVIPRIGDTIMSGAYPMHMFHLPMLKVGRYHPQPEYLFIKRLLDIVISAVALVVLSPIFLVTAIAIKATDHGPVFYKQIRLTKDGKEFGILKFRSMRVDAEKDGVARLSSGDHDDRIPPVGKVIRACRIDELPQLVNILKGELSIVGPRPERPEIAAQYCEEMPEFSLRLQAKAGLTGYAQIYGKYNTTPYDKLVMDLMYIAHPSIVEDLKIMFATVKILFMPESTEGISEGQTTAMSGENH